MKFLRKWFRTNDGKMETTVSCRNGVKTVKILPKPAPMPRGFDREGPNRHRASRQEMRAMLQELHLRLALHDSKVHL